MPRLALSLSRRAAAEHYEITEFSIDRFGREVADQYMAGLDAACERLRDFPQSAPVYAGINPEIRVLVHRSHRVFYRVETDRVLILRILHHARATPDAL